MIHKDALIMIVECRQDLGIISLQYDCRPNHPDGLCVLIVVNGFLFVVLLE